MQSCTQIATVRTELARRIIARERERAIKRSIDLTLREIQPILIYTKEEIFVRYFLIKICDAVVRSHCSSFAVRLSIVYIRDDVLF